MPIGKPFAHRRFFPRQGYRMICNLRIHPPSSSCFIPRSCHTLQKGSFTAAIKSQIRRCHSSFIDPQELKKSTDDFSLCSGRSCLCGRRHLIEAVGTALFPIFSSKASELHPDEDKPTVVLNRVHPPRPDWYEELYAFVLDKGTKSYEAEIAGLKSQLFANLRGKAERILEVGIGTGPNLKYYASDNDVHVFGIDPNRKMEKYSRIAAEAAGLPPTNFKFMQAVAEALPLSDDSVDAVIGTLILCSVKDVDLALQEVRRVLRPGGLFLFIEHVAAEDGTFGRFVQGVLDPLQQAVSDGCHLTRKTGQNISDAGFSSVNSNMTFLSTSHIINPHVYGMACK